MTPTDKARARRVRQTRAKLAAEIERERLVEDFRRSLVEVPVYRYRRQRSRAEMHRREVAT